MASEGRPDLVLFVGPVIEPSRDVEFSRPTDVVVVHAPQDTSASYRALARQGLRNIIPDVTGKSLDSYRKIAISAFSKGGSFTDEVLAGEDLVDAVILNDAVFGDQHQNLKKFLQRAASGDKLMVITNSNNRASAAVPMRARESVEALIGDEIGEQLESAEPAGNMPIPSGGVWKLRDFFWYDYVDPDTGENDISHLAHHDLAEDTWDAHLVPYFRGTQFPVLLASAGLTFLLGAVIFFGRKK